MDVRLNVILSFQVITTCSPHCRAPAPPRSGGPSSSSESWRQSSFPVSMTFYIAQAQIDLGGGIAPASGCSVTWRVMPRITVAGSSARRSATDQHPARRHLIRGGLGNLQLWERCHLLFRWSPGIILWQLSGPLAVFGIQIPGEMVFPPLHLRHHCDGFCPDRSAADPSELSERAAYGLLLRPGASPRQLQSIAFLPGRAGGKRRALGTIRGGHRQYLGNRVRSLKFQGFNLVISQIAVVFPYVIQAQRYFASADHLGDVTQTASAFSTGFRSPSFFAARLR